MNLVRKLILASALLIAPLLALLPDATLASSGGSSSGYSVALPFVPPASSTVPPPGFTSNADQAVKASEADRTMLALYAREHPLQFQALVGGPQSGL
jgi:hypothetical protein